MRAIRCGRAVGCGVEVCARARARARARGGASATTVCDRVLVVAYMLPGAS
jgi:hypothetical protein